MLPSRQILTIHRIFKVRSVDRYISSYFALYLKGTATGEKKRRKIFMGWLLECRIFLCTLYFVDHSTLAE